MTKAALYIFATLLVTIGVVIYLTPSPKGLIITDRDTALRELLVALQEKDIPKIEKLSLTGAFSQLEHRNQVDDFKNTTLWNTLELTKQPPKTTWDIWSQWAKKFDATKKYAWEQISIRPERYSPKLTSDLHLIYAKNDQGGWVLSSVVVTVHR